MNRPRTIRYVSHGQFSLARINGCKVNGADYHYDPASDTLIRMDVWKARIAESKEAAAKAAADERAKWVGLQESLFTGLAGQQTQGAKNGTN